MFSDFEPGDFVINLKEKEWGIGQIQSIIREKITQGQTDDEIYRKLEQYPVGSKVALVVLKQF